MALAGVGEGASVLGGGRRICPCLPLCQLSTRPGPLVARGRAQPLKLIFDRFWRTLPRGGVGFPGAAVPPPSGGFLGPWITTAQPQLKGLILPSLRLSLGFPNPPD